MGHGQILVNFLHERPLFCILVVRQECSDLKTLAQMNDMKAAIVSWFATVDVMQERYPRAFSSNTFLTTRARFFFSTGL